MDEVRTMKDFKARKKQWGNSNSSQYIALYPLLPACFQIPIRFSPYGYHTSEREILHYILIYSGDLDIGGMRAENHIQSGGDNTSNTPAELLTSPQSSYSTTRVKSRAATPQCCIVTAPRLPANSPKSRRRSILILA